MGRQTVRQENLTIVHIPTSDIKPAVRNARTHTEKQVTQIAHSIKEFGFNSPIIIDGNNTVVAGHGRLAAAKILGIEQVPTISIGHLSKTQLRAYAVADNRIAELAGWDEEILKLEFQEILDLNPEFDLTLTGFEVPEIDLVILQDHDSDNEEDEEEDPKSLLLPDPVSKNGDLWMLGNHRILCGDARQHEDYVRLLQGEKAQLVFTDPPYNLRVPDTVGLGKTQYNDFAMASGEQTKEEFTDFLKTCCERLASFSMNGAIQFICMDWRHIDELSAAGKAVYRDLLNICIWNKPNGGMGSLYRSKYELIFVFKVGSASHINNIQLGQYGRNRTNVWDYARQNQFHTDKKDEPGGHPTIKPVAMVADAILDCSNLNGIVLDPFGGSGTTLLAAEKTSRQARLIEYEPTYVDLTIRRWQQRTGKDAIHAKTGELFNKLKPESKS